MSATRIGQIGLDLVVNKNQFESQMAGITGLAKKAGAALAAAFGVKKLIDFGKHRALVCQRPWQNSILVHSVPWQKPLDFPKNKPTTWEQR